MKSKEVPSIKGFLKKPKTRATGSVFPGRFSCCGVQWTGAKDDLFATFTITAEEVATAVENRLIWTDQDVQRGIQPGLDSPPPREIPVCDGYPDPKLYIFDQQRADEITEKLLANERLFLNPLIWNLRPGHFEAYWNDTEDEILIYQGRIYLPDSHHRHQALLKAVRSWQEDPNGHPRFVPSKQFKVELYFLSKEDEGNYFFDKNQRTKPTAKSKAYDLTTLDDLSLLAKRVIDISPSLTGNVNRVTDRLAAKNPQVITLSTLREMMRNLSESDQLDEPELDGLAKVAAGFYELLAEARPELGRVERTERKKIRASLLVDAAVMMHGYSYLMRDYNTTIGKRGLANSRRIWREKLQRLSSSREYTLDSWSGDFFSKENPIWEFEGVIKHRSNDKITVLNTGAARAKCGQILRQLLSLEEPMDLGALKGRGDA